MYKQRRLRNIAIIIRVSLNKTGCMVSCGNVYDNMGLITIYGINEQRQISSTKCG